MVWLNSNGLIRSAANTRLSLCRSNWPKASIAYRSLAWAFNASAAFGEKIAAEPAVIGSADFASTHLGYTFWFASAENLAAFEAAPASYAPAWGGYCAYGISGYDGMNYLHSQSQLSTVPSNVDRWAVLGDEQKLYMFRGEEAMELFIDDTERNLAGGEQMWASWFGTCTGYYNTQCFKEGTR